MIKWDPSSRMILDRASAHRFEGETLLARLGRAVCEAEALPRKELFEAWEVARRIRRRMRGGPVLELAAGHGLLSALLILLDDTTPFATCIDVVQPRSHRRVLDELERRWPRLRGRVRYVEQPVEGVTASADALVVSVHACGSLTDRVLDVALAARCRVGVLPCCHDFKVCDTGGLAGWMHGAMAIDATRVARLRQAGYRVFTLTIPDTITPQNRLLLAEP